jgi:hypothetical protein
MDFNQFTTSRQERLQAGARLTQEDIATFGRLLEELRETTQSRGTFEAAGDLLERLGYDPDSDSHARPDGKAH